MSDKLGRYFTTDVFSSLLVSQLNFHDPNHIIDLGVGGGTLIKAAINKWSNANFYATDIDKTSVQKIKKELPFVKSFHFDNLKNEIAKKIKLNKGSFDISVCNPPFLKIKSTDQYDSLFEEASIPQCKLLSRLTSDVIFLAKNLELLKMGGSLGIIVPDSLIAGKDFAILRKALLENHKINTIIQLPRNIYPKTEALTHIMIIEKGGVSLAKSSLYLADKSGCIIEEKTINTSFLESRMDFSYHKNNISLVKKNSLNLKGINADIKRGNLSSVEVLKLKEPYIHTTNFPKDKQTFVSENANSKKKKLVLTQKGDILMQRVGRNVGSVIIVTKGKAAISDCILRIRVEEKYRDRLWTSLNSKKGKLWIKTNIHGVCANVISKSDLLNFPLSF